MSMIIRDRIEEIAGALEIGRFRSSPTRKLGLIPRFGLFVRLSPSRDLLTSFGHVWKRISLFGGGEL